MDFLQELCQIAPPYQTGKQKEIILPNDLDFFFRSKQKEIFEQYQGARFFLSQTEGDNCKDWFNFEDGLREDVKERIAYMLKGHFYEAALMYYNIIVDLSWVLCYVSIEATCYDKENNPISFESIKSIANAEELLRLAEGNVREPISDGNPFQYIKKMQPGLHEQIDKVIDFWKEYKETPIRIKYNFCKHRGKPLYSELDSDTRFFNLFINSTQVSSSIKDVEYKISLEESTEELLRFDNEKLFPYIKSLIEDLEKMVNPSPFALF